MKTVIRRERSIETGEAIDVEYVRADLASKFLDALEGPVNESSWQWSEDGDLWDAARSAIAEANES